MGAKAIGEKAYEEFHAQRLQASPPVKFHESLKKSKLKTFSELNKKVKFKSKTANEIILTADRALFGQMVIIAENIHSFIYFAINQKCSNSIQKCIKDKLNVQYSN